MIQFKSPRGPDEPAPDGSEPQAWPQCASRPGEAAGG
jgi:hypothetical protein